MALTPKQKDEVKRNVMPSFDDALDRIDRHPRKLSRREEGCLGRALAAMACGACIKAAGKLLVLQDNQPRIDLPRELSRPVLAYPLTTPLPARRPGEPAGARLNWLPDRSYRLDRVRVGREEGGTPCVRSGRPALRANVFSAGRSAAMSAIAMLFHKIRRSGHRSGRNGADRREPMRPLNAVTAFSSRSMSIAGAVALLVLRSPRPPLLVGRGLSVFSADEVRQWLEARLAVSKVGASRPSF